MVSCSVYTLLAIGLALKSETSTSFTVQGLAVYRLHLMSTILSVSQVSTSALLWI